MALKFSTSARQEGSGQIESPDPLLVQYIAEVTMVETYQQVAYTPYEHSQKETHSANLNVPDDTLLRIFSYFWDDGILSNICYSTN